VIFHLLGRVALIAQRPIVVKLSRRSVGRSVRTYVRRSVCPVHCGKTADQIRMQFGVIGRTGLGMRQVVRFRDRSTGKGTFWGEFGAHHCNQWGLYGVCNSTATRPSFQITFGKLITLLPPKTVSVGGILISSVPSVSEYVRPMDTISQQIAHYGRDRASSSILRCGPL